MLICLNLIEPAEYCVLYAFCPILFILTSLRVQSFFLNITADENGFNSEKANEPEELAEEEEREEKDDQIQLANGEPPSTTSSDAAEAALAQASTSEAEQHVTGVDEDGNGKQLHTEKLEGDNNEKSEVDDNTTPAEEETNHIAEEAAHQEVDDGATITRKMEVPNAKVCS